MNFSEKKALLALAAFATLSSSTHADVAQFATHNGIQTLTISGRTRAGIDAPGVVNELPAILMKDSDVLKVKRSTDVSSYKGTFVSGMTSCPTGWCEREITIEQKSAGTTQNIAKIGSDQYIITGEAAHELYAAIAAGGVKIEKSLAKTGTTAVRGENFSCLAITAGGLHHTCTIAINDSR